MSEQLTWVRGKGGTADKLAALYDVDAKAVRELYRRMCVAQYDFPRNSTQLAEDFINDFEDNGVPLGLGTDYDTDLLYDVALHVA